MREKVGNRFVKLCPIKCLERMARVMVPSSDQVTHDLRVRNLLTAEDSVRALRG